MFLFRYCEINKQKITKITMFKKRFKIEDIL